MWKKILQIWNAVFDWFGNGKKLIVAALFLLAGMIGQSFSQKTLAQIPFILMAAAVMCVVNALFSKIASYNINILLYLLINVAATEIGLSLTSYNILGSDTEIDSMTMMLIWGICILAVWILQTLLIRIPEWPRRIALAAGETVLSAVAVCVAFVVPILLSVLFS
jgi:hypothetical protein